MKPTDIETIHLFKHIDQWYPTFFLNCESTNADQRLEINDLNHKANSDITLYNGRLAK